jgi:putative hydrolase of the HAD superfamily
VGASHVPVAPLVEAFFSFEAPPLETYPGVRKALTALRRRVPVALVTDGDARGQRSKLRALGLETTFDVVVFSDELGREHRKPSPFPFRAALDLLGIKPEDAVHIADNPEKDMVGAAAAGMRSIRVLTGEFADVPSAPAPWMIAGDAVEAIELLQPLLSPAGSEDRVAPPVGRSHGGDRLGIPSEQRPEPKAVTGARVTARVQGR